MHGGASRVDSASRAPTQAASSSRPHARPPPADRRRRRLRSSRVGPPLEYRRTAHPYM